ncbi:hypothetical protein IMY05_003G0013200 [Salix suchowensis]|nr:hypothetical protein IMY05_003G0012900 [Salix suchowensis]KAG5248550.1 hypothetical protein IMY05_003G0013200 [Salix suchowensis]
MASKQIYFYIFPCIIPNVQCLGVYLATLLSKTLVTSFIVDFLELEEPFIYGYVPRYIIELVANPGSLLRHCNSIYFE